MNTFLKFLGSIALIVIFCWIGVALLHAGLEITGDLFYWFRRKVLPGVLSAFFIGAAIFFVYRLAFRRGRA
jgi:hypothetical protein